MTWASKVAQSAQALDGTAVSLIFEERDGTSHVYLDCITQSQRVRTLSSAGGFTTTTEYSANIPALTTYQQPISGWTCTSMSPRWTVVAVESTSGLWTVTGQ